VKGHPYVPAAPRPMRAIAAALVLAVLGGCAVVASLDPWPAYRLALADAAVAEPAKALPLQPLPETATVKVVSWMSAAAPPCAAPGCRFRSGGNRWWVTLHGEVQATCRQWNLQGDALRERLEQLLGLPPQSPLQWRKTHLATFEVAREALQRPCLGEGPDASGRPRCALRPSTEVDPDLRRFVLEQMASTWVDGVSDAPGYPFTRLGYTYDWHPSAAPRRHYGASEFVLRPSTDAVLVAFTPTDAYCAAAPE
jgi:hypothetical protein